MRTTKKMIAVMLFVCIIICSSEMEIVEADAFDCLDACQTGCVQRNSRLQSRCESKCTIRCSDVKKSEHLG